MRRIVVVGASLAGSRVAETLRAEGYNGQLTVVGAEPHPPYDRYPLSKDFVTGRIDRAGLDIVTEAPNVEWRLGETATGLDLRRGVVEVGRSGYLPFDGLIVASGSRPRGATVVKGVEGAFVLRTVEDALGLRDRLSGPTVRVVVVGGGLIGAEVADVAAAEGHDTTLVHSSAVPTTQVLGRHLADHLLRLHRAAGIEVRSRTRARDLSACDGRVTGVLLDDGTRLDADVVVLATGTVPNTDWLHGSGLGLDGGLDCGPTLHASGNEHVLGAGDVVGLPHPLLGGVRVRVEHWASTRDHAALAARNLLAGPDAAHLLTALPEFGTTLQGVRIRSLGCAAGANRSRVLWGSVESGEAVVALASGERPVAVLTVNATGPLTDLADQLYAGVAVHDLTVSARPVATS